MTIHRLQIQKPTPITFPSVFQIQTLHLACILYMIVCLTA